MLEKTSFDYYAVSPESTFEIITKGNALVKTLCSPLDPIDNRSWDELLEQIADPRNKRILRKVDETKIDRTRVYNPKSGRWFNRTHSDRAQPKDTIFTKKTATTLIPQDGQIELYQPANPQYRANIGIIFDLTKCFLKDEKYIFLENKNTHQRWWLKRRGLREQEHKLARSVSLELLKKYLQTERNKNRIPKQNELLVGVSRDAVIGVFSLKDTLEERLNALAKKSLIWDVLKKDVPIFILGNHNKLSEYTIAEQMNDVNKVIANNHNSFKTIVESIPQKLIKQIRQEMESKRYFKKNPIAKLPPEIYKKIMDDVSEHDISDVHSFVNLVQDSNEYTHLLGINYQKSLQNFENILKKHDYHIVKNEKEKDLKKQYYWTVKNNFPNIYNLIYNRTNTLFSQQDINNVISHLFNIKSPTVNSFLEMHLMSGDAYRNTTLYLLAKGAKPSKNYRFVLTLGWKEEREWDRETKVAKEVKAIQLTQYLLINPSDDLKQVILKHLPEYVGIILKDLARIYNAMTTDTSFKYEYKLSQIEELRLYFLKALNQHHQYVASYDDKRFFEKHLLAEIQKFDSRWALQNFQQKFTAHFLVNQQRHPIYDKVRFMLFARDPMPTIKKNFQEAVERRLLR